MRNTKKYNKGVSRKNNISTMKNNNNCKKNKKEHNSNDILRDIKEFDYTRELMKIYEFKTSSADVIRADVINYAIKNIKRYDVIMLLSKYINISIADEIESGIFENTLIRISNEDVDCIDLTVNIYNDIANYICTNLDANNHRICNQTLKPSLMSGKLKPFFVAFMPPQHIHPVRWAHELERKKRDDNKNTEQRVTDIYKCYKCGDRKSITMQMQTRCADEPMTIFVTCLTCHNTFTISS